MSGAALAQTVMDGLAALTLADPWLLALALGTLLALLSALALPGAGALCLLAGPVFGPLWGTLLVGTASTLGAWTAFAAARWGTRGSCGLGGARAAPWREPVNAWIARGGAWAALAVLALRLVPLLPYPLLNVLLGASSLPLRHFLWPSWLGLTLASLPWVWAGQGLAPLLRQQAPHAPTLAAALVAVCTALLAAAWLRRRWPAGQQVGRAR